MILYNNKKNKTKMYESFSQKFEMCHELPDSTEILLEFIAHFESYSSGISFYTGDDIYDGLEVKDMEFLNENLWTEELKEKAKIYAIENYLIP